MSSEIPSIIHASYVHIMETKWTMGDHLSCERSKNVRELFDRLKSHCTHCKQQQQSTVHLFTQIAPGFVRLYWQPNIRQMHLKKFFNGSHKLFGWSQYSLSVTDISTYWFQKVVGVRRVWAGSSTDRMKNRFDIRHQFLSCTVTTCSCQKS